MAVITVKGEISKQDLGLTDIHEHIFCSLLKDFEEPTESTLKHLAEQKISIENLGHVIINPFLIKDNLILSDKKLAEEELMEFKRAGGKTIVDPSTVDLGRDVIALRDISNLLGINIITTTGYYRKKFHPPKVLKMSVEEIEEEMTEEIEVGISGTGIRAGLIGELGTSEIIYPDEKKVLIAAARTNAKTGVPIMIHLEPWKRLGIEVLKILHKNGANLEKVYLCHLDCDHYEDKYYREILKNGAYLGFDTFGEISSFDYRFKLPSETEKIDIILKLINEGYIKQIMIGGDICNKHRLHKFGRWGYDHILRTIIPVMIERGFNKKHIDTLLIENPKEYLDIKK